MKKPVPPCRKRRFPSEEVAAKVVEKLQEKGRDERRYYECGNCGGWHTTSMPRSA